MNLIETFKNGYIGYANYLYHEVLYPSYHNYFYALIAVSALVWSIEIILPWRKNQGIIRKDFWMDVFYMFFNFFLFSLVIYNALSNVVVDVFNTGLQSLGLTNIVAIELSHLPYWIQLLIMFVLADFVHWNIHRLLHRVPWLWEFHKVHHSVQEMGFAAHLRFHWMENVLYKTLQYIPLAMVGFGLQDFFVIHIIALLIGHLNHANLNWDYGPFKYLFNNPKMHIWHHALHIPKPEKGVNFGLSLSIWDYLFGTAYIPKSGKDEPLGFDTLASFPKTFWKQLMYPFASRKTR